MPRDSLTRPIPPAWAGVRGWEVRVDGETIEGVGSVILDHPRIGTLTYGLTTGGYDGWTFREAGGGGSVILPFAHVAGMLHVGVVHQRRANQGGMVWNAPRGFLDPDEDRAAGARRELFEETGMLAAPAAVIALPGERANPNSTFFETWGDREGVSFFAVGIDVTSLVEDGGHWTFLPHALDSSPEALHSRAAEEITRTRFIPWCEAAGLGDLFTAAAVARLLAHLRQAPG